MHRGGGLTRFFPHDKMVFMPKFHRFMISDFILLSEVPCPCKVCVNNNPSFSVDPGIVSLFDRWRMVVGHALPITSFWRCKSHNTLVGGKVGSLHLVGAAIDFYDPSSDITPAYLDRLSKIIGDGGLGIIKPEGYFHIDCGHLLGLPKYRRWEGVQK